VNNFKSKPKGIIIIIIITIVIQFHDIKFVGLLGLSYFNYTRSQPWSDLNMNMTKNQNINMVMNIL